MSKSLTILVAMVAVASVGSSCKGAGSELVGKWRSTKEELHIEFFADGKFYASSGLAGGGEYKITNPGVVQIDISNSLGRRIESLPYRIEGDTLYLTHSETDVVGYQRLK